MNFFVCALACSAIPVWLTSVGLVTSATLVSILPYTVIPVECITSSFLQLLLLNSSKPNRPEVTPSRNKYHLTSKSPPQPLCTSVYGRKEILGLGLTLREDCCLVCKSLIFNPRMGGLKFKYIFGLSRNGSSL